MCIRDSFPSPSRVPLRGADKNRYNPDTIPELEAAAKEQLRSGQFDLDASLALLVLYQMFPGRTDVGAVSDILRLALAQLPKGDFDVCLHLVPASLQAEEPVASLVVLADLANNGEFEELWGLVRAPATRDLLAAVPGFDSAVREFAAVSLGRTFARVKPSMLEANLGLKGGELDAFCQARGWRKALRDVGVAGTRSARALKCLHAQYGFHLGASGAASSYFSRDLPRQAREAGPRRRRGRLDARRALDRGPAGAAV